MHHNFQILIIYLHLYINFYFILQVSIKAQTLDQQEPTLQTIKSGEVIEKQYIRIADSTDSIQLGAWDKHITQIQLAKSYTFSHVSLRKFDNVKSLTTSPESKIEEIAI